MTPQQPGPMVKPAKLSMVNLQYPKQLNGITVRTAGTTPRYVSSNSQSNDSGSSRNGSYSSNNGSSNGLPSHSGILSGQKSIFAPYSGAQKILSNGQTSVMTSTSSSQNSMPSSPSPHRYVSPYETNLVRPYSSPYNQGFEPQPPSSRMFNTKNGISARSYTSFNSPVPNSSHGAGSLPNSASVYGRSATRRHQKRNSKFWSLISCIYTDIFRVF